MSPDNSSDLDALKYSFNYGDYDDDCFLVGRNTTSVNCSNDTTFGDNAFIYLDDYNNNNDDAGWDFFDVYYSTTRFAVETTMALLSMTLNVLGVSEDQDTLS